MLSRLRHSRRSPAAPPRTRCPRPSTRSSLIPAPCPGSPSPRGGPASRTLSSPHRRRKPCSAFQLSLAVPAIDRNTKRANCLDALWTGRPGAVSAGQVVHAVVSLPAELVGGGNGAPRRDAAEDDFALPVGDLVSDGGGVDEHRPGYAALMAGDLRADVEEQRARSMTAPRGRR